MPFGNWRAMFDSSVRFSARMTVSALAIFAVVQFVPVPLHGLWAVLTAVILTQANVGGSIRATVEYVLGTIAGAVYASLLSLLLPHDIPLTTGAVLGLSIAPLAYAAARNAAFRAAPFTAIIVLLLAGQFDQSPIAAALTRLLEVALGGAIAVLVSVLVVPELAQDCGRDMAVAALERLAHALPVLLAALSTKTDPAQTRGMQERIGALVTSLGGGGRGSAARTGVASCHTSQNRPPGTNLAPVATRPDHHRPGSDEPAAGHVGAQAGAVSGRRRLRDARIPYRVR
jgi:uncharacterized membrane protein YccC